LGGFEHARPRKIERLLAITFYFGLAPYFATFCLRGDRRFLRHHFAHALAFSALLLLILALTILVYVAPHLLPGDPQHRQLSGAPLMLWLLSDTMLRSLFLLWLLAWAGAVASAAVGLAPELPLIARLARSPRLHSLALIASSPTYLVLLIFVGIAFHASLLADSRMRPAAAYLLYDDLGFVPQWVFEVGFYRISLAATARWGPGSVVVAPLTKEALDAALAHGRFVFVASHGNEGRILIGRSSYGPDEARRAPPGRPLQLLYIAGCDVGDSAPAWRNGLAPAEVILFNRESYVYEHFRWLWLDGPARIRALPR